MVNRWHQEVAAGATLKAFKYSESWNAQQLRMTLKRKVVDAQRAGGGYKETAKRFQFPQCARIQRQKYSAERLQKPDLLRTDEVKIKLLGHNQKSYVWRKNRSSMSWNTSPAVKHVVDPSHFGVVLQSGPQETLHR